MALSGAIGIMLVPSQILVPDQPAATAANIAGHELLLRLGIVSSLVCQVCFLFMVLALNRLFAGVHDGHAKLMVSLVIAAAPIAIVNELFHVAALVLGTGAVRAGSLAAAERDALALVFLEVRQTGIAIAGVFWGLWLFPFGLLVIRSGFIPKVLGGLLIAGGFSYLIDSCFVLLAPQHRDAVSAILMLPLAVGELAMISWLLIKGVRVREAARVA